MAELTILYDGTCRLCRSGADRVRNLDRGHRIALVDLHDPDVPARFPQVNREEALRLMHAVDAGGRVSSGVDAWAEICRVLPGWRAAAWLLKIPGIHRVAGWVYSWVARNRFRWNRADASCVWHGPAGR